MAKSPTLPAGLEIEMRPVPPPSTAHCRANTRPGEPRGDLSRLMLSMPVGGSLALGEEFLGYGTLKNFRQHVSHRNRLFRDKGRWLVRQDTDGWRLYRVDPALYPPPLRGQRD